MANAHLVPLSPEWSVWSTVVLRGTGFPVDWLQRLAPPGTAEAVDGLIAEEERRNTVRGEVAQFLAQKLEHLGSGGARGPLWKLREQVLHGALKEPRHEDPEVEAALARALAAELAVGQALLAATGAWREGERQCQRALRKMASDERFREAVAWQNLHALQGGIDWLLRQPPDATGSKVRQKERLVTRYLQRYCAKNDTIGFFGPVGWAHLDASRGGIQVSPAAPLLRKRSVYLEHWAVDLLAQTLGQDPELRPSLAPRRLPTARLDGGTLHYGMGKAMALPPAILRTLELCDGVRSAAEVARGVAAVPAFEATEAEVLELLSDLAQKSVISWTVEVPAGIVRPEVLLEERLAHLAPSAARDRALGAVRQLRSALDAVGAAAGDAEALPVALGELDRCFTALTGQQAQRSAGQAYAGRTLVYEDCVRNLDARIGEGVLQRLGAPLSLVLSSARWFTYELSRRYQQALRRMFDELAGDAGEVPFVVFYAKALELFPTNSRRPSEITAAVVEELQSRWSRVLGLTFGQGRLERSAAELTAAVEREFGAPGPGWPEARYQSPDLMIAADDLEALARGEHQIVLGELHSGANTLFSFAVFKEHPQPDELVAARAADVPEVCAETVAPKESWGRADNFSQAPHDVEFEVGTTMAWRPRSQVEAAADLVVLRSGDSLCIQSKRSGRHFEAAEVFGNPMRYESTYFFHPFPKGTHGPRITVDGVVLAREHWRFDPTEVSFVQLATAEARFLEARRWVRRFGLPRWAFISIPEEGKPFYVDFHSPVLVEMVAHLLQKASRITVTEMLPALHQTWLPDAQGQRYCCELRLAAVDARRWRPRPGGERA